VSSGKQRRKMKVRAMPMRRKVVEVREDRKNESDYTSDNGDNSDGNNNVDNEGRGDAPVDKTMDEDEDNIDVDDELVRYGIEEDDADEEENHEGTSMTRAGHTAVAAVRPANRNGGL
jgi:hypothetical protein